MDWKDYGKTGLKLMVLFIVGLLWWFVAIFSQLIHPILFFVIIPIAIVVAGYIVHRLWRWK